jgi:hypothetical protein
LLLLLVGHLIGWNFIFKPFIHFSNRGKLQGSSSRFFKNNNSNNNCYYFSFLFFKAERQVGRGLVGPIKVASEGLKISSVSWTLQIGQGECVIFSPRI